MSRDVKQRAYGGKSADERRAERRTALLTAGRDLWCEGGWAAVTMRGVCSRARLTDRYFYEAFADRDALLVAVGEGVRDEVVATILTAVAPHADAPLLTQLRAALAAVVGLIVEDPGSVQIFFGDHGGSEVLEALRRTTIGAVVGLFTDVASPALVPGVDIVEFRVALLVGIGGFVETMTSWRAGALDVTADEVVEMLASVARRLGAGLVDLDQPLPGV